MPIKTSYDSHSGVYVASDGNQYATGLSHAEARVNLVRELASTHRYKLRNDETVPVRFTDAPRAYRRRSVRDQSQTASDFAIRKVFSQPLSGGYSLPAAPKQHEPVIGTTAFKARLKRA